MLDGPLSQAQAHELAVKLAADGGTPDEIARGLEANTAGLNQLLAGADAPQQSADPMAAAHHQANVLFNVMRGGVFVDGTRIRARLAAFLRAQPATGETSSRRRRRAAAVDRSRRGIAAVRAQGGEQGERLLSSTCRSTSAAGTAIPAGRGTASRSACATPRAGAPRYEGNWRDIFQNWEALGASVPGVPAASMIAHFVNASTADGFNPYRIARDGIDWEVTEPDDPWSDIGYWGDHQVVYLLRLLEAAQAREPGRSRRCWDRAMFSYADVPYRLAPYARAGRRSAARRSRFDDAAPPRAVDARAAHRHRRPAGRDDGDGRCCAHPAREAARPVLAKLATWCPTAASG